MRVIVFLHFFSGGTQIHTPVDFLLHHRLLHHFLTHRATNVFRIEVALAHCFVELLDRVDALLVRDLQHAAVDFRLDFSRQIELFAFLQQQRFVDERRDQLGLALGNLFLRLLLGHAALFQRVDAVLCFFLQHRERDDVVVDLGNDFVNDLHLAFLGKDARRREHQHYNDEGCKVFEFHKDTPLFDLLSRVNANSNRSRESGATRREPHRARCPVRLLLKRAAKHRWA